MTEVRWTTKAKLRYLKLIDYLIFYRSRKELSDVRIGLEKAIEHIVINPTMYAVFEDFDTEIRRCVITKRSVMFYQILDTHIEILGVFDTRQDLSNIDL